MRQIDIGDARTPVFKYQPQTGRTTVFDHFDPDRSSPAVVQRVRANSLDAVTNLVWSTSPKPSATAFFRTAWRASHDILG